MNCKHSIDNTLSCSADMGFLRHPISRQGFASLSANPALTPDTELARKKNTLTFTYPGGDCFNLLVPSVTELTEHQHTLTKRLLCEQLLDKVMAASRS